MIKRIGLFAGPIVFAVVISLVPTDSLSREALLVLATAGWMAVWWVSEAVPIYATALLPLLVFPMSKVSSAAELSGSYMDQNIVLFMGGFFLASAVQRWGLHRRIALAIIRRVGSAPTRLVLGFMLATAFLSMWVSNTATAIMMLPIAGAVIFQLQRAGLEDDRSFSSVLLLGIAYSASIGGMATLIGTPPNIVFVAQLTRLFPERPAIGFGQWMGVALPLSAAFLAVAWLYLTRLHARLPRRAVPGVESLVEHETELMGAMSRGERMVAVVFFLTALAWIFRIDMNVGVLTIPGWASWLGVERSVHDSTVAVASALVLFCLPVNWRKQEFLLDWESAVQIPWGILLLFGGGIALANGFHSTGLADWVGQQLRVFQHLPLPLLVLSICLVMTFLTELTSNTATASIFMPILAGTSSTLHVAPEILMIPATLSASCAFMLPVATPPNAIVFGSGHLTIPEMARAGLWMNLIGAILITMVVFAIAVPVFGL